MSGPPGQRSEDWHGELGLADELMRQISRLHDPQETSRLYATGVARMFRNDRWFNLSRRGLDPPAYRITRSSTWTEPIDPWTQPDRLPRLEGGLLGELVYCNEPRVVEDLRFDPADPAADYLRDMRALVALPQYEDGVALNVTVLLWADPARLDRHRVPMMYWQAGLFGRGILNLILRRELAAAYATLDRELEVVGQIQRSLLPVGPPAIPGLELAAHYRTARRAGGNSYDVWPLPDGRWGVFIADVSGHGTPAAVLMAVVHALARSHPGPSAPPSALLGQLNRRLVEGYTRGSELFVTAAYAVYDPKQRSLMHANAGHNPLRLCRRGAVSELTGAGGLPLGIVPEDVYPDTEVVLEPDDRLVLHTDGITEAFGPAGELFGTARLDAVLRASAGGARGIVAAVLSELDRFTGGRAPEDDQTLLVLRVLSPGSEGE